MTIKYSLLISALALFTAFSLCPQEKESRSESLIESLHYNEQHPKYFVSAHRGGRYIKGFPENAMPTFEYTLGLVPNAFLEMDVNITADSVLVLMHDNSLERTTTASGLVSETNWATLKKAMLRDDFGNITPYHVPEFTEVLDWARPRGVIIKVDIKRGVPYERVIKTIEAHGMTDQVILITYSAEGAAEAYSLTREMMISASIRNLDEWQRILETGIPVQNLIAFTGTIMSDPELYQTLHANGILCILGTMGNIDNKAAAKGMSVYHDCMKAGIDVFATDFPEATEASIRAFNP